MLDPKDCLQFEIDLDDSESDYLGTIDAGVFEDMFVVAGIMANSKGKTIDDVIRDICPDNMVGSGGSYFHAISLKLAIAYDAFLKKNAIITQRGPEELQ